VRGVRRRLQRAAQPHRLLRALRPGRAPDLLRRGGAAARRAPPLPPPARAALAVNPNPKLDLLQRGRAAARRAARPARPRCPGRAARQATWPRARPAAARARAPRLSCQVRAGGLEASAGALWRCGRCMRMPHSPNGPIGPPPTDVAQRAVPRSSSVARGAAPVPRRRGARARRRVAVLALPAARGGAAPRGRAAGAPCQALRSPGSPQAPMPEAERA
jgi:hypothetical protein